MNSPYISAGPGPAPSSQHLHPVGSTTLIPQSSRSSMRLSPAVASTALLLLLVLTILVAVIGWIQKRRSILEAADKRPLEKAGKVGDVEALAVTRPLIPVTPLPDVRWTPQVRSISSPVPDKSLHRVHVTLPLKRARSPPPPKVAKPLKPFAHSCPKSTPAHALSFSHLETPHGAKSPVSPVLTPQALAVSGMETRPLGRFGGASKG